MIAQYLKKKKRKVKPTAGFFPALGHSFAFAGRLLLKKIERQKNTGQLSSEIMLRKLNSKRSDVSLNCSRKLKHIGKQG